MASEAFTTRDITLPNGKALHLVPLSIKNLRKFMRIWADHIDYLRGLQAVDATERPSEADLTDKQFDVYLELAVLGLEKVLKDDKDVTDIREFVEEEVDEKSLYVILDATGGLKLDADTPNLPVGVQED